MTLQEEKDIRLESAKMGAEFVLIRLGILKDEISQREAFRLAGEARVRSWVNDNIIKRVRVTGENKVTYSRIELETVMQLDDERRIKYSRR